MKSTLGEFVREALSGNRIEEAVIKLENEALLRRSIDPAILAALPASRLAASPLLLKARAESLLPQGDLAAAGDALTASVAGLAAGTLREPLISALSLLAIVHVRTGQRHEAETILRFLLDEREHEGERMPGESAWALALGLPLLGPEYAGDVEEQMREYRAAATAFDRDGKGERAALALLEALTRHAAAIGDADWFALRLSLGQRASMGRIDDRLLLYADALRAERRQELATADACLARCLGEGTDTEQEASQGMPYPYDRFARLFDVRIESVLRGDTPALTGKLDALAAFALDRTADVELRLAWAIARTFAAAARHDAADAEASFAEARVVAGFMPIPGADAMLEGAARQLAALAERPALEREDVGTSVQSKAHALAGVPGESSSSQAQAQDPASSAQMPVLSIASDLAQAPARSAAPPGRLQPSSRSSGWHVRLFGGLLFTREDGATVGDIRWKRSKTKELLLYLLLQPERAAVRERLVEDLFPDAAADKSDNRFYVASHQLKQIIAERLGEPNGIAVREGLVRLKEGLVAETDAERYDMLMRVAAQLWPADREQALALYGQAVPLYGALAPELQYVDWLDRLRETQLERQGGRPAPAGGKPRQRQGTKR
ncbi:hypothetical protein [Cohnella rhizosphaerae]|uniref:Bacterial transcriptional activator domain-containing protein n=1 Tax=Cohnella rhizosphaerae TaxID=1457232 RepID=A0A9X4KQM3_9BACL|nr:hypothetical protein [Cohnella rhizosphaerae]MDG0809344.1 hypothetical protein [Cohnella rhizosphaerae]